MATATVPYVNAGMSPATARSATAPIKPLPPAKPPKVKAGTPNLPGGAAAGAIPGSGLTGSDKAIAKYLASLFGPTHTDPELAQMASGYVSSAINPQIDNLTSEATQHLTAGSAALQKIYAEEATRLGGIGDTVRGDNTAAATTEQNAGNALRDYLQSEGGKLSAGVGAAGAAEPAGSALANAAGGAAAGIGALGAGTAGEAAARGYTGLSELNAHGAAEQGFADNMPGLAKLQGGQQLGSLAGQVEGDLHTKTDSLLAQIPGMTQDLYTKLTEDNQSARQAKAQILNSFFGSSLDRNMQAALTQETLGKDVNVAQLQAAASKYGTDTRAASSAASLNERVAHDKALEQHSQAMWGVSYQKLQDAEKKAADARANGGLTADALTRVQRQAATDLQTFYHGKPAEYQSGPNGQRVLVGGTGPGSEVQYHDAIQSLLLKYPALGPKKVIQMVNTLYKPGEGGRPAMTPKQQRVATQLFPDIFGKITGGK